MLAPREHLRTRRVRAGRGAPSALPDGAVIDIESVPFTVGDRTETIRGFLDELDNDSVIVVKDGKVIHEQYRHGDRDTVHQLASMSKSIVGLVAAAMVGSGELDPTWTVASYVPGFAGCAYGETMLGHLLDMRTKISYDGRPYDQLAEAARFFAVVGFLPRDPLLDLPADIRGWMRTSRHEETPGTCWRYENGNTEAVAEVMMAVTGRSLSDLVSDRLWSRIGAEADADWALDPSGREMASGGLAMSLRDVARVGEMIRNGGAVDGRQIMDAGVVAGIRSDVAEGVVGAMAESDFGPATPGYGYHDFWWIPPQHGTFLATGRFGQHLWVSPDHGVTVAMMSSAELLGFKMYGRRLTAMMQAICEELTA